jgi:hypothetical protein
MIAGLRLLAGDGVRVPNYPHVLVAGLCDETDPFAPRGDTLLSVEDFGACKV